MEPEHPSNKTLQYWQDYNISASDVPWGNLTVSVSKFWKLINKGIGINNSVHLTATKIFLKIPIFLLIFVQINNKRYLTKINMNFIVLSHFVSFLQQVCAFYALLWNLLDTLAQELG